MSRPIQFLAFVVLAFTSSAGFADEQPVPALKSRLQSLTPKIMKAKNLSFGSGALVLSTEQPEDILRKGDIIVAINEMPVIDVDAIKAELAKLNVEDSAQFHLIRDNAEIATSFVINKENGTPVVGAPHWQPRTAQHHNWHHRNYYSARRSQQPKPTYSVVSTYFATDRTVESNGTGDVSYGNGRGALVYGRADVTIPQTHEAGHIETGWITSDPEKVMTVKPATPLSQSAFYADITKRPSKTALIFVHGYHNTFEDAALRTAQLAYDMHFTGIPAFFSWPSQGKFLEYVTDEGNVSWALADFKAFLTDYIANSKAEKFYLVAHSMGCRLLTLALKELYARDATLRSKVVEVFLAAADIDTDDFNRNTAQPLVGEVNSITIYQSSRDWALRASQSFHDFRRLGDRSTSVTIIPGMNTIDATAVDTGFIGHSYFGDSTSVLFDMVGVVEGHLDPASRKHISTKEISDGRYWVLTPE